MKAFTGMINGAITTFSNTVASCCGWSEDIPPYVPEKYSVVDHQPPFVPQPCIGPMRHTKGSTPAWEQASGRRHEQSQAGGFSVRKRLFPGKTKKRRPQISAPSNFRHVSSGGYGFSGYEDTQPKYRPRSFHPLVLNIHGNDNRLSSMIPLFGSSRPPVTPPQRAIVPPRSDSDGFSLKRQQSSSTLSFHIPRRPTNAGSVFDSPQSDSITRPAPARLRAYTSPEGQTPAMSDLIQRVATAMMERDILQEQLDDVIERQSIYVSSRPSTALSVADVNMEPMPDVPALPPDAPSFSERISIDRPRTAPLKASMHAPPAAMTFAQDIRNYTATPNRRRIEDSTTPPPPLPLLFRPPLRKKKSFSRVSSWLGFQGEISHSRDISIDSVTNKPLPVPRDAGFYEVAAPTRKSSSSSADSVSDWSSDDEKAEQQTVPTSWSPSSSATVRAVDPLRPVVLSQPPLRQSVIGVAF